MIEHCKFKTGKVKVTPDNILEVKLFEPSVKIGDTIVLSYSVDVHYLGRVATYLKALLKIGVKGKSSGVLIKKVFQQFNELLSNT